MLVNPLPDHQEKISLSWLKIKITLLLTTLKTKKIYMFRNILMLDDLEGAGSEKLKQQYKNDVELEYHIDQLKAVVLTEAQWNSGTTSKEDARQDFIKEEINNRSPGKVYSDKRIISVIRVDVKRKWGYGFLSSIIVRRSDKKEYTFSYADLPRLNLNDIENMNHRQDTIQNVWNREMGSVSQLTQPQISDEVKKFYDGTLMKIQESLIDLVNKNELGRVMKRQEQLRRFEEYVSGRPKTIDPHFYVRPMQPPLRRRLSETQKVLVTRPLSSTGDSVLYGALGVLLSRAISSLGLCCDSRWRAGGCVCIEVRLLVGGALLGAARTVGQGLAMGGHLSRMGSWVMLSTWGFRGVSAASWGLAEIGVSERLFGVVMGILGIVLSGHGKRVSRRLEFPNNTSILEQWGHDLHITSRALNFTLFILMLSLYENSTKVDKRRSYPDVKMDEPNITMEEYIRLEEEKARRRAIVFNDNLTSIETHFCEPTVSSLNDEIDFRISFDESDDEDYRVVFDKNSFSYKIISINDLKKDLENDNDKVNVPLFPSPEPTVSYFDDLDFFKDFENEFPAVVYNDAPTSKSDLLTELILSPQHIDEFNLETETSLYECDKEEQNVLYFNDLFPFNVIYPDDSKSDKDNDDDKIDIKQSLGDNVINTDVGAYAQRYQYGVSWGPRGRNIDEYWWRIYKSGDLKVLES
ncbi:hypothetical protein Tco_0604495 [Tanacetum coccineum]